MRLLLCLPFALLMSSHVWCRPEYRDRIPNGYDVKHPCREDTVWESVGHQLHDRGEGFNQFGSDFRLIGNTRWTKELCELDSDGDNRSNGEELGDPDCVWTPGKKPTFTEGITHPGICEPLDSALCQEKNTFLKCEEESGFRCDVMNEADVQHLDLHFPVTRVPGVETTYICMTFDLPTDEDYHIVAFTPVVDNAAIVHHMVLYGCPEDSQVHIPAPGSCDMPTKGCWEMVTVWSVGVPGRCYGNTKGFPMGKTGVKRLRLEIHWNNPSLVQDYTDSSGIRIYYRPVREGVQDLAVFTTGQTFLEIPPGRPHVNFTGTCPGYCTAGLITEAVYVMDVLNHMHNMGKSMKVEVYRHGRMFRELSNDLHYDYDHPVFHEHDPPFQLLPGDEIRTTCVFTSMSTKRWVYFGEGTSDEMCFAFILLYPKQALPYGGECTSQGPLSPCDWTTGKWIGDCNWSQYIDPTDANNVERWQKLDNSCNMNGFCRPECREVTKELEQHPCMQGEAAKVVRYLLALSHAGTLFLTRLNSCSDGTHPDGLTSDTSAYTPHPPIDCGQQCAQLCPGNATQGEVMGDGAEGSHHVMYLLVIAMTTIAVKAF